MIGIIISGYETLREAGGTDGVDLQMWITNLKIIYVGT